MIINLEITKPHYSEQINYWNFGPCTQKWNHNNKYINNEIKHNMSKITNWRKSNLLVIYKFGHLGVTLGLLWNKFSQL